MFDVGEKVVCVNDKFEAWVYDSYNQLPRKDNTYTIRAVEIGRDGLGTITSGQSNPTFKVLLVELVNDQDFTASGKDIGELGFRSDRFAPLEDITDSQEKELVYVQSSGRGNRQQEETKIY